jgi:hypothetical protein
MSTNTTALPIIQRLLRVVSLLVIGSMLSACTPFKFVVFMALGELRGPFHNTTTVADLTGNGFQDVVLINTRQESESIYWSNVTYWFNAGEGRFSPTTPELPPYHYISATAGDLDGDGDPDLLYLAAVQFMPFKNMGGEQGGEQGMLVGGRVVHISEDPGTPGSLHLGDLNNNGELDAFVAGCCGMILDKPAGGFDYLPSYAFTWIDQEETVVYKELGDLRMRGAALGDLDGDGSLDVFAALLSPKPGIEGDPADRVLLNDGAGSFRDSGQRLGDFDSTAVALGDLDGDGDLDALVGTLTGAVLWFNQGGAQGGIEGEFALSDQSLSGREVKSVYLTDFNGNGHLDALIATKSQAVIWWNDGQGNFERSRGRFNFTERHGLAVGDFNADGNIDVFVASYDYGYKVWFNRGDGRFRAGR